MTKNFETLEVGKTYKVRAYDGKEGEVEFITIEREIDPNNVDEKTDYTKGYRFISNDGDTFLPDGRFDVHSFKTGMDLVELIEVKTNPKEFSVSSFDAEDWANEFCRLNSASDKATMIGWFANAIMAGYDHAMRKNKLETEILVYEGQTFSIEGNVYQFYQIGAGIFKVFEQGTFNRIDDKIYKKHDKFNVKEFLEENRI